MFHNFMKFLINFMLFVACGALLAMMLLTSADVGMRYLFNSPLVWANELTEICMGIMVPASVAYCSYRGAHVSVDLVYIHLPKLMRKCVFIFAEGIVFLCMILLAWKSIDLVEELKMLNTITPDLNLPMWPIGAFFIFTFSLSAAVTLVSIWKGDEK